MKQVDADGGGTVSRLEWIQYLGSPSDEGGDYFDFETKKLFDEFDEDKSGFVERDEFNEIILKSMNKELRNLKPDSLKIARSIIINFA